MISEMEASWLAEFFLTTFSLHSVQMFWLDRFVSAALIGSNDDLRDDLKWKHAKRFAKEIGKEVRPSSAMLMLHAFYNIQLLKGFAASRGLNSIPITPWGHFHR